MKWPLYVALVRHDTSAYNILKGQKAQDPAYQEFLEAWNFDPHSDRTLKAARGMCKKYALRKSDAETPLADAEGLQAFETGEGLSRDLALPDVIFVSPYLRAKETLRHMTRGWPQLATVRTYEDERIREQEHGLANIYNDWRIFHALHEDQRKLFELEGRYWYRYPQGENVPDVRARNRSWQTTITRDFSGKRVLAVTHHLNILALRANLERLGADQFIELDEHDKPINCGVTVYRGYPDEGTAGRLKLDKYNVRYYR